MRLWSLHPKYLDSKGIVALWREALLAKAVLTGNTKGYRNHPQLNRFKESQDPVKCINFYLEHVYNEALRRGYKYNREKIDAKPQNFFLEVTDKQMDYEYKHLLNKLKIRDIEAYKSIESQKTLMPHPMFIVIKGEIESWEVI